jgi:hypothetical protein
MNGSTLTALAANPSSSVVCLLSSVFCRPSSVIRLLSSVIFCLSSNSIIRSSSFRDYFLLKNTFH